jgi:hypothetical protein
MGQSRNTDRVSSHLTRHGLIVTIAAWRVLSIISLAMACQNLSAPGLYYDEAVFGGLAKDFVTGQKRLHTPGYETVTMFNRRLPVFVRPYLGALECWMLIPAFTVFDASLAVLRLTSLFWAMLAVLFFMLGIRRGLGTWPAIAGGVLLALDPAWFFLGVLEMPNELRAACESGVPCAQLCLRSAEFNPFASRQSAVSSRYVNKPKGN